MQKYKNIQFPIITSLFFISPILYLENINENYNLFFSLLLLLMTINSINFWLNPIKNSKKHIIDKYLARFCIFTFIIYKLFINKVNQNIFIILTLIMFIFFYLSNYYSTKKWYKLKFLRNLSFSSCLRVLLSNYGVVNYIYYFIQ